jgi:AhpD family alkylhydroperoxidase
MDGSLFTFDSAPTRRRIPPPCDTERAVALVTSPCCHTDPVAGISCSYAHVTSEDEIMDARFDLFANETAAKIGKRFANVSMVVAQSPLPKSTQELVSLRASQINGCGFCVDMHTKDAAAAGETPVRLNLVAAWREATVFTEAERAALALAEEGTRLADACHGVSDETWAQVRKHYDDDQIAALVYLIAMINAANRLGVIVRNQGGSYEPGMFAGLTS